MQWLIETANATGTLVLDVLSPLPEDAIVLLVAAFVVWVWIQNARAWVRMKRAEREAKRCVE